MTLMVCLDDNNGMMFNHRRQSSDRVVDSCIKNAAADGKLIVCDYSAKRFPDACVANKDTYRELSDTDVCFAETGEFLKECLPYAKRIVIFRWNRVYPADTYFPAQLLDTEWVMTDSVDFLGYSHETITQEDYVHA